MGFFLWTCFIRHYYTYLFLLLHLFSSWPIPTIVVYYTYPTRPFAFQQPPRTNEYSSSSSSCLYSPSYCLLPLSTASSCAILLYSFLYQPLPIFGCSASSSIIQVNTPPINRYSPILSVHKIELNYRILQVVRQSRATSSHSPGRPIATDCPSAINKRASGVITAVIVIRTIVIVILVSLECLLTRVSVQILTMAERSRSERCWPVGPVGCSEMLHNIDGTKLPL